ncbi:MULTISPECIES: hybrid sensor histidine kinase/response regulator [Calothrix]|uniref:histidine kinase n=2 Tax=Calothrix TaxID=1186 RepID=A0ABR8AGV0_9CYAN|nr:MULTISPECIES: response regulator [Calothrix]MBD2199251.1 response regulator [Calothrix parietina FACHB-288]MBD2227953.1 response regulator [Calothrix anomala FACHB-343]
MPHLLKPASQTNILLVDDTPDNLRLLSKMLELQGYTVRKSLNGRMALQAAQRDPPDLILLDINMPEMNGYEVCQKLRTLEGTPKIPIIFISALDEVNDKIRAFELGGQDYITKPFQELEVLARIRNQLFIQQHRQRLEEEIQERQHAQTQLQLLNSDLERQVELRTSELQQSLNFAATVKRISDKVRDSLDPHQILQSAVEELAIALQVNCCDAVLYDRQSANIRYQYAMSGETVNQSHMLYLTETPEIYQQLQQQRSYCAFCQIPRTANSQNSAILACSIFDDRVEETGILGDLWLFKNNQAIFSDIEVKLVQQVANQCAIALRQARLYAAAQSQIQELQRINQLKDDFLNTVTHELRSPIANMKMMIQLLSSLLEPEDKPTAEIYPSFYQDSQTVQYLTVLQENCDRELQLLEDILSLQHLEARTYPQQQTNINLQYLMLHIIEPFERLIHNQQQSFKVNLAPELPTINIDSFSLSRIITELLNNAWKYTPPGEKISLDVSVCEDKTAKPQRIQHPRQQQSSCLQIIVSNTGVEISPEELPRIFDKFYRIPNQDPWKHSGTGLGLTLVKKLVEYMNGLIWAESKNHQTKFILQFPFVPVITDDFNDEF